MDIHKLLALNITQIKRTLDFSRVLVKLLTGLGPVTSSLPMRCATTCATAAFISY